MKCHENKENNSTVIFQIEKLLKDLNNNTFEVLFFNNQTEEKLDENGYNRDIEIRLRFKNLKEMEAKR